MYLKLKFFLRCGRRHLQFEDGHSRLGLVLRNRADAINLSKTDGMWIGSSRGNKTNRLESNGQMSLSKLWESTIPMIQNYF